MPVLICKKCGWVTNAAVSKAPLITCDYEDQAEGCYAAFEDNHWGKRLLLSPG